MARWALAVLTGVALVVGCSHPPRSSADREPLPVPTTLVIDTVLDGVFLGQTLRHPSGVFIDARGALIVCDEGNNRVLRFNSDFRCEFETGGRGSASGLFNGPVSGAVDGSMGIRIVDRGNRRICRLDSRLQHIDELPFSDIDDPLKFGSASGVLVEKSGSIWVTDRDNNRIAVFNLVGQFEKFIGEFGYSGGGLLLPGKLGQDSRGSHYVCDVGNKRIVIYDEYGNYSREIADPEFLEPTGMCIDADDRVWVIDRGTGRIFLFSAVGTLLLKTDPSLAGLRIPLVSPTDIALFGEKIMISDSGNDRLVVCRAITNQE